MKKILSVILLAILILSIGTYSYFNLTGIYQLSGIFITGLLTGILLMIIKLISSGDKITSYKRELEKESINSDEASSKVKVLESKIQVLEKALEKALNK